MCKGIVFYRIENRLLLQTWHGCPCRGDPDKVFKGQTYGQRRQNTLEKHRFLTERGYELHIMTECQLKTLMETHDDLRSFIKTMKNRLDKHVPLCPRDALRYE